MGQHRRADADRDNKGLSRAELSSEGNSSTERSGGVTPEQMGGGGGKYCTITTGRGGERIIMDEAQTGDEGRVRGERSETH